MMNSRNSRFAMDQAGEHGLVHHRSSFDQRIERIFHGSGIA